MPCRYPVGWYSYCTSAFFLCRSHFEPLLVRAWSFIAATDLDSGKLLASKDLPFFPLYYMIVFYFSNIQTFFVLIVFISIWYLVALVYGDTRFWRFDSSVNLSFGYLGYLTYFVSYCTHTLLSVFVGYFILSSAFYYYQYCINDFKLN